MRIFIALIAGLLLTATGVDAQTTRDSGAYAIVDVRIELGDGAVIERGTILLRDGFIQAVGPSLKVPPDAEIIKGAGMVAYPGFIDAGCTLGLKLPDWEPDQDRVPDTTTFAPASMREANRKWVRPELRARDHLALSDLLLGPMRRNGFTTALFVPAGGIITGVSALANLNGLPRRESLISGSVGLHMSFSPADGSGAAPRSAPAGGTGYPGSLLGIIADLRQTLMDATHHREVRAAYERTGGARPPVDDSLDALLPALDGKMPALFSADSKIEIDRAFRLADEFHLRLILTGAGEAWKEAPQLARRAIPVLATLNFGDEPGAAKPKPPTPGTGRPGQTDPPIAAPKPPGQAVPPVPAPKPVVDDPPSQPAVTPAPGAEVKDEDDTPQSVINEQHKKWQERVANAAQLEKSGAQFAFVTSGLKSPTEFWKNLRMAIKAGLSGQAALRALTINPATILGVNRQTGSIAAGKMANVLLMTGNLTDPASKVKFLFIDKSRFEPDAEPAPTISTPAPMDVESDKE